jgi:hypothetical protein
MSVCIGNTAFGREGTHGPASITDVSPPWAATDRQP